MDEKKEQEIKIIEMSDLFLMLEGIEQEYTLGILRALNFAQKSHKMKDDAIRTEEEMNEG